MLKGTDDNHGVSAYADVSTSSRTKNGDKQGEWRGNMIKMSREMEQL